MNIKCKNCGEVIYRLGIRFKGTEMQRSYYPGFKFKGVDAESDKCARCLTDNQD